MSVDEKTQANTSIRAGEVVALMIVWGFGFLSIWLITANYKDGQQISLENAIAYIAIAVTLISGGVLFRGLIAEFVHHRWMTHSDSENHRI